MKIKTLEIRKFRGTDNQTFDFDGESWLIWAENKVGKTTIADAISWLFTGKDTLDRAAAALFRPNTALPTDNTEVVVTFDDGRSFGKVLCEDRAKKTGKLNRLKVTCYLDGAPCSTQREFEDAVASLAGSADRFRMLTDPKYFAGVLPWETRRKILIELCGDIGLQEVIASKPELQSLADACGPRSVEAHKAYLKDKLDKLEPLLVKNSGALEELARPVEQDLVEPMDVLSLKATLAVMQDDRTRAATELAQLQNGGAIADKRKRIAEIDAALQRLETVAEKAKDTKLKAKDDAHREARGKLQDIEELCDKQVRLIDLIGRTIAEKLKYGNVTLKAKYAATKNESPPKIEEIDNLCPTCKKPIDADKIEAAYAAQTTALEKWNSDHAERLKSVATEANVNIGAIAALRTEKTNAVNELATLAWTVVEAEKAMVALKAEIAQMEKTPPVVVPEVFQLTSERNVLDQDMELLQLSSRDAIADADAGLKKLDEEVAKQQAIIAGIDARREAEEKKGERIKELDAESKKLNKEKEGYQEQDAMIKDFGMAQAKLLEGKVQSMFPGMTWRLFEYTLDGEPKSCCRCEIDGIPFDTTLNTGSRVVAGLTIIDVLQKTWGVNSFVVIDNAEGVTVPIAMDSQLILLKAQREPEIAALENQLAALLEMKEKSIHPEPLMDERAAGLRADIARLDAMPKMLHVEKV